MKINFSLYPGCSKESYIKTRINILFALVLFCCTHLSAQITLTLKPDASTGKDAFLASGAPAINYCNHPEFASIAWTCAGDPCFARNLIQFDLSGIPANAIIISAKLSLYANPAPENCNGIAMQGSANASLLQRVTSDWEENTVTWNSQPTTTAVNQVMLPQSSFAFQNYQDIDVKNMVQDMVNNPSGSFGFMLKLQNEAYYNCMIFASSDYADTTVHPQLLITFTSNEITCFIFRPEAKIGKDVFLASGAPATNYGNHTEFAAIAWTCAGDPCFARNLIQFDLSGIPANAIIINAKLSLYANPAPENCNGIAMQGSANASLLQRVTSDWEENTVTWNSQPTTTAVNQVMLPQSSFSFQNYQDIDVKNIVQDMIDNPSASFGFMLKPQNENYYNCMIFASSDYSDTAVHPKFEICYINNTTTAAIKNSPESANISVGVFPNPFSNYANISYTVNKKSNVLMEISDILGKIYKTDNLIQDPGEYQFLFKPADLGCIPGMYLIKMKVDENYITRKVFFE